MTRLKRQFSANLGLLFTEFYLPDAIIAAHQAGFDAVECHWPYHIPASDVRKALAETGLKMLGLNTARGKIKQSQYSANEFGLNALPFRQADAREAIDQAIDYARDIQASAIHMMAGISSEPDRFDVMAENLEYASDRAPDLTFLIEPINTMDIPNYALNSMDQARSIMTAAGRKNIKIMFDCYHMGMMGQDVIAMLTEHFDAIGHIQFANTPDRGPPHHDCQDYQAIFDAISDLGYTAPLGAEYRPQGATKDSLDWMDALR